MGASVLAVLPLVCVLQAPRASVTGTIRDAVTGAALAGAVVELRDLGRGTDAGRDGRYLLRDVPAGPQHLTISRLGYATRTVHALVPAAGTLELSVALQPEPIRLDPVDVHRTPGPAAAQPVSGADRGVLAAALAQHPLLAEPDAFAALAGSGAALEPESPVGLHVRGGAADHTGFLLDGIPVLAPYHAAGLFSALNPDALARVELISVAPSPALPDVLGGTVAAVTRERDARLTLLGGVSTTHARATIGGPLPADGGYVLSGRTGYPGFIAPGDDSSYLTGGSHDLLGRVQLAVLGGQARVLAYDAHDRLSAAADVVVEPDSARQGGRNAFTWRSRSIGLGWTRPLAPALALRILAWRATAAAGSTWHAEDDTVRLAADRSDDGVVVALERHGESAASEAGVRVQRQHTDYRVTAAAAAEGNFRAAGTNWIAAAFARHHRPLTAGLDLELGAALLHASGDVLLSPRAKLRGRPTDRFTWTLGYGRSHQFTQSLQNGESVVRYVFPADVALGAGIGGIPVAHSDQATAAASWLAAPGVELGAHAFARTLRSVILVAPANDGPFSTGAFRIGGGEAYGGGASLVATSSTWAALLGFDWQRVRLGTNDSTYAPAHATARRADVGIIFYPSASASLRVGFAGGWGRSSTAIAGSFEWEACNVLDRGCEFAGSPRLAGQPGAEALPAYLRVDVGARKHWHLQWSGRDLTVGLFGTVTNLFGRRNLLARTEPVDGSGARPAIGMVPRAPLVIGTDWRF